MLIQFFSADAPVPSFSKTKLKVLLKELFKEEGKVVDNIGYIFCSDEYLLDINQRFLNHDYYTDIITFDISEKTNSVFGEVYISVDRVKENAKKLNQPILKELLRVIIHGALHLCGYQDKTESQKTKMRSREDYYIKMY